MPKGRIYIAYGSNLNLTQMAHRCPTARPLGTADLKGYELLFRGKPSRAVATIEPRAGSSVPVLLWRLRPGDEAALDRYEGVPRTYDKRMLEVEFGGKCIEAMTYVMTPGFRAGQPSLAYYYRIAQGYHCAGFDHRVLTAAVTRSEEAMRREASLGVPKENRISAARNWDEQIGAAGQLELNGGLFDFESESYDDSYLESLCATPEGNRWDLNEDELRFMEDVLQDHQGGLAALDSDQIEHLLCFYSDFLFGETDRDEVERQCREYLEGLDEPAPEQDTLFGLKWW